MNRGHWHVPDGPPEQQDRSGSDTGPGQKDGAAPSWAEGAAQRSTSDGLGSTSGRKGIQALRDVCREPGADGESISSPKTLPELNDSDTARPVDPRGGTPRQIYTMFLTESPCPNLVVTGNAHQEVSGWLTERTMDFGPGLGKIPKISAGIHQVHA